MLIVLGAITSWLTLITAVVVLWRTMRQDKVLDQHSASIDQIQSGLNGEMQQLQERAAALKERADRTAEYANEMQVYAASLRRSLALIEKAEKAGEHVVNLHAVVASQVIQAPMTQDAPTMVDP